ncbi:MAG: hypothetical protein ACE5FN_00475 [Leptospirillia bacterium]
MHHTTRPLDLRAVSHGDIPTREGMGHYLDSLLEESYTWLSECAVQRGIPDLWRDEVEALRDRVAELRVSLSPSTGYTVINAGRSGDAMPGMARAVMFDLTRVGLFTGFRDRCESLGSRICDSGGAGAALEELRAGLNLLGSTWREAANSRV